MANLPTNYVDDVLDASMNGYRHYTVSTDDNGTYLVDVTVYTQNGTTFGAADINQTNIAINGVRNIFAGTTNSWVNSYPASATGTNSFAIGINANASGNNAYAVGENSIASGNESIAIGRYCNATGSASLSIGSPSRALGTGAVGVRGFAQNSYAIAIGGAFANGSSSIAIGSSAYANDNGSISIGNIANSSGFGSTALGYHSNASETNATAIGYFSKSQANNSTALGTGANATTTNTIQLGDNNNLSTLNCKVALTTTSDERDKTDIEDLGDSLAFINSVRAVRFKANERGRYAYDEEKLDEEGKEKRAKYGLYGYDKKAHKKGTKKGERERVGVIAQEVQKALENVYGDSSYANIVNDNLHDEKDVPKDVENQLGVTYTTFIPFLIKAIQELSAEVEELKSKK